MGELYRAGVRRLTPRMRQQVQQPQGPLGPPHLSWLGLVIHLGEREKATGEWKPLSDFEELATRHGAGVMSVNRVERGRMLVTATFEGNKLVPQPPGPALVVVLTVQSGEHLIYVTGQSDANGSGLSDPDEATPDCVEGRLRGMIDSLTLARALEPRS